MREKEHDRPYDRDLFKLQACAAIADSVRQQAGAGIDIFNDGEQSKASFFTYIIERLEGFSATEGDPVLPPSWKREIEAFPDYYNSYFGKYSETVVPLRVMTCIGPVRYRGYDHLQRDIANLQAALADVDTVAAFTPSTFSTGLWPNAYYPTDRDYIDAVADALREEYLAIVEAGVLLPPG